jgi:2TM domain
MSSDTPVPHPELEPQHLRAEAQRRVRRLRVLYTILGIYAVLSVMWFAIDMADGTESLWFYWPMLGTGLVTAVTAIVLVGIGGLFGADWENRRVERYLSQHRSRNETGSLPPPSPSTNSPTENDRNEARP